MWLRLPFCVSMCRRGVWRSSHLSSSCVLQLASASHNRPCDRIYGTGWLERLGLLVFAAASDALFDLPQPLCFNALRPHAMDFIVVFTMQELFEVLADFLPLPIALRCLRVSRRGQPSSVLRAWSRARGRSYAFIRRHVHNALIGGVWCPGLDCVTTGMLHLDTGAAPLQEQILSHYHVNAVDELDLRPSTADFTETMDDTPMMAWHCGNSDTLRWRLLSTFLQHPDVRILSLRYFRPPFPQRNLFLAHFLHGTCLGALVFSTI